MAAELGLEVADESPSGDEVTVSASAEEEAAEEVVAKKSLGWNLGLAASVGLIKGESFSGGLPTGGTVSATTTPYGFNLGPFDYTVSTSDLDRTLVQTRVQKATMGQQHRTLAFDPGFDWLRWKS